AVAGSRRVPVADPDGVVAAAKDLSRRSFGPATAKYRELGTVANLLTFNRLHALPTLNFQQGTFADAEAISGEALNAARRVARRLGDAEAGGAPARGGARRRGGGGPRPGGERAGDARKAGAAEAVVALAAGGELRGGARHRGGPVRGSLISGEVNPKSPHG